jgi:hypothetical protein
MNWQICTVNSNLNRYTINHNNCNDDNLIIDLFHQNEGLMKFFGLEFMEPTFFEITA